MDQLRPGSKVELFSRQKRKDWQVFGAQTDKFLGPADVADQDDDAEDGENA